MSYIHSSLWSQSCRFMRWRLVEIKLRRAFNLTPSFGDQSNHRTRSRPPGVSPPSRKHPCQRWYETNRNAKCPAPVLYRVTADISKLKYDKVTGELMNRNDKVYVSELGTPPNKRLSNPNHTKRRFIVTKIKYYAVLLAIYRGSRDHKEIEPEVREHYTHHRPSE